MRHPCILLLFGFALASCKKDPASLPDAGEAPTGLTTSDRVPAPPTTGLALEDRPAPPPPATRLPMVDGRHCLDGAPLTATKSHDEHASVWFEEFAEPHSEDDPARGFLCLERGGRRKVLLRSREAEGMQNVLNEFDHLLWSRDDRVVFFATSAWTTSNAAHGVEVATSKERFITDGEILDELEKGPFKGNLFAIHFRLDEEHGIESPDYRGRMEITDIIDVHGKRLAKVPSAEEDKKTHDRVLGLHE